jgi:hypothetical protein
MIRCKLQTKCIALDFWCQCTQQKLQSICAVLTFDPQLKNILTFSVKDRYQLNYFRFAQTSRQEKDGTWSELTSFETTELLFCF